MTVPMPMAVCGCARGFIGTLRHRTPRQRLRSRSVGVYTRCDFETPARGTALVNRNMSRMIFILALFLLAPPHRLQAQVLPSQGAPKTYVEMTPGELAKQVPALKHLVPATSQDELPTLLQRVGANVADFFTNFSNTTCNESVDSTVDASLETLPMDFDTRFSYENSRSRTYSSKFNYLALIPPGADKTRLRELRTNSKGETPPLRPQDAFVSIGFVSMAAHFHPDFQSDSRFCYLGREVVAGQSAYVVSFSQRPGAARHTSLVVFTNKTAAIFVQGIVWVDPVSFDILRLRTDIQHPEANVGLVKETTEVEYAEVTFPEGGKKLWLPRQVNVSGQLGRYAFHNRHRYSDYRLFNVESRILPQVH